MKRTIEPEWLDVLPPDDPEAINSRRDLRRVNRIMGHAGTLFRLLRSSTRQPPAPQRIVELGAGDGTLMLRLAQQLSPTWPRLKVVLVDRQPAVTEPTLARLLTLGWSAESVAADVFDWLKTPAKPPADLMFANLFLHHFSETQLTQLLALVAAQTKLFAACEPRRAAMPLAFSRLVGLIGCNAVTEHDAVLSVRAGFDDRELSALWPASAHWRLQERRAQLFTHTFLAERTTAC